MKPSRSSPFSARMLLLLIAGAALLGDFLSPVPPDLQNLERVNAPPTRLHWIHPEKGFSLRPFVYRYEALSLLDSTYEEKRDQAHPLRFFCDGYRYRLLGLIPASLHLANAEGLHLLGTDDLGRDVLARLLAGAQTSLLMVAAGLCLYALVGLVLGGLAGWLGGWVDAALMRLAEFVLALPALYLILALRAAIPSRLPFWQTLLLMCGVISGIAWPPLARGVRGLIFQMKGAAYVEAARSLGCSGWQVFRRHILPALPPFLAAQSLVAAPIFLLGEVVLSFLDVGFHDGTESWGSMLRNLRDTRVLTDFWWNLSPLAMVFLSMLGLNALARRDGGG